jgi:hypothetical protein
LRLWRGSKAAGTQGAGAQTLGNSFDDLARRNTARIRNHPDPAGWNEIGVPVRDFVWWKVIPVASKGGANAIQELAGAVQRGWLIENAVDEAAGTYDRYSFGMRHDRRRFVFGGIGVGYEPDYQPITELSRLAKKFDMAGVEQVADGIRIHPDQFIFCHWPS